MTATPEARTPATKPKAPTDQRRIRYDIVMSVAFRDWLKAAAKSRGVSASAIVREAIRRFAAEEALGRPPII